MFSPNQAWSAIAGEFTSPGPIYRSYVIVMAAIGPLAATVGTVVFGVRNTLFATYDMSVGDAVTSGVLRYLLSLGGVFALSVAIDALASTFSAQPNRVQALKVAAYGTTPYWVGGVFALFPKLSPLGLLIGLYSFRLYAVGLAAAMKAPRERATAYAALVMVAGVLIAVVSEAIVVLLI